MMNLVVYIIDTSRLNKSFILYFGLNIHMRFLSLKKKKLLKTFRKFIKDTYYMCNFHRWVFETLRVCIWNMHLGNIYAYNIRIRSTPKRIFRISQDLHHRWNYFFWRKVFSKRFAPLYFFSIRYILLHFWCEMDWIMHLIIDQS